FVPSLLTGAGIFQVLKWLLKNRHFKSLWPYTWKTFLRDRLLLEDHLRSYIEHVLAKTEASHFRIISFGSSRPIVAAVLARADMTKACDKWIAISSPLRPTQTMLFLAGKRFEAAYAERSPTEREPNLVIFGTH